MDEVEELDPDDFKEVVEVFRILRVWRDERDASLLLEEFNNEPETKIERIN